MLQLRVEAIATLVWQVHCQSKENERKQTEKTSIPFRKTGRSLTLKQKCRPLSLFFSSTQSCTSSTWRKPIRRKISECNFSRNPVSHQNSILENKFKCSERKKSILRSVGKISFRKTELFTETNSVLQLLVLWYRASDVLVHSATTIPPSQRIYQCQISVPQAQRQQRYCRPTVCPRPVPLLPRLL